MNKYKKYLFFSAKEKKNLMNSTRKRTKIKTNITQKKRGKYVVNSSLQSKLFSHENTSSNIIHIIRAEF